MELENQALSKVLVIGGGGREHAIAWKLLQSPHVGEVVVAPGNGGIAEIAHCKPYIKATDVDAIVEYVQKKGDFDLVVIGPDDPLAMGLTDRLEQEGVRVFGPNKLAAQLESSKIFSKALMKKYSIPTAEYAAFENGLEALKYLKGIEKYPVVIKADGLALGKGVVIAQNYEEARNEIVSFTLKNKHGNAGKRIIIEEFLTGFEVSLLAFCDGVSVAPCMAAQDHKRAFDNDEGGNTGGMGTICPVPEFGEELQIKAYNTILLPVVEAMRAEGIEFKGVIFANLMVEGEDIKVLEFNARFGDPETQSVLRLLKSDLFEVMNAVVDQKLGGMLLEWYEGAAVCVIAASGGYPDRYQVGYPISLGEAEGGDVVVFHAGTKLVDGEFITAGGRVLGVSAYGDDLESARESAYQAINEISFQDMHYRKDI